MFFFVTLKKIEHRIRIAENHRNFAENLKKKNWVHESVVASRLRRTCQPYQLYHYKPDNLAKFELSGMFGAYLITHMPIIS